MFSLNLDQNIKYDFVFTTKFSPQTTQVYQKDNYIHFKLGTFTTKLPHTNSHNFVYLSFHAPQWTFEFFVFFYNLEDQKSNSNIHSSLHPQIQYKMSKFVKLKCCIYDDTV